MSQNNQNLSNSPDFGQKRGFGEFNQSHQQEDDPMGMNSSPPPNNDVAMDDINSDKFSEDENLEDHYGMGGEEQKAESEGSGEDLDENAERDYKAIDALDNYENAGMDNQQYANLDPEAR